MMFRNVEAPVRRTDVMTALALSSCLWIHGCGAGKEPILDDDPPAVVALKKAGADIERVPRMGALSYNVDMAGVSLTPELLALLAEVDGLAELKLTGSKVTDETLAALPEVKSLTRLELTGSKVTNQGLVHLASLPSLFVLNLTDSQVTGAGLKELGPRITGLNLTNLPINDEDLESLTHMKALSMLMLSGTNVTAAGVNKFKKGGRFPLTVGIKLD